MNPDQILAIVTLKVMNKTRYYFSLVTCVLVNKKVATALSLANLCSLCSVRHSTSVLLLRYILALAPSHPLLYLCDLPHRVLDCTIRHRHGLYKLKIMDCYDFTTCEIIIKLEQFRTVTLSL